jgi:hypothetical protein
MPPVPFLRPFTPRLYSTPPFPELSSLSGGREVAPTSASTPGTLNDGASTSTQEEQLDDDDDSALDIL